MIRTTPQTETELLEAIREATSGRTDQGEGLTAQEISAAANLPILQTRRLLKSLIERGLVKASMGRRRDISGRPAGIPVYAMVDRCS